MRTAVLLFALLCSPAVRAQITVTEADVRAVWAGGHTEADFLATRADTLASLTRLRGGPHTFDFRPSRFEPFGSAVFTPIACGPDVAGCDDARLSAANLVLRVTTGIEEPSVAFADLDANGLRSRGGARRGDPSFKYVATPAALVLPLPLTMGRTWTASYTGEFTQNGAVFGQEQVEEQAEVVAHGMLVTPSGSAGALLVRERRIATATVFGRTTVDTTITYRFVTRGTLEATIDADGRDRVTGAGYTVITTGTATHPPEGSAGLVLAPPAPNPATHDARLAFALDAPRAVRLAVYDALGREVALVAEGALGAGPHTFALDAGRLAPGAYAVRLVADGHVRTRVLTVAR
jgi:hypothetical protein